MELNFFFFELNLKISLEYYQGPLIAQLVKNLAAMQETPVWFLGHEGSLEKG